MTTHEFPLDPAVPVRRPFSDVATMAARELRRTVRSVDMLITALLLPMLIMLVFVIVFGGAVQRNGDYVNYIVPGILILCAGFGSAITAVSVAKDMKEGILDRFRTMPIFGASVLVGHVVASIMRNLLACAIAIGVALLLGYRPAAGLAGWLLTTLYLVLAITAFTWMCCAIGLVLSDEAAASINFVFLFLPYVSSGFVPVDTMPQWLRGFAIHEPFTPIIETARSLLAGSNPGANGWGALAWLVGILVISYVASLVLFRRRVAR